MVLTRSQSTASMPSAHSRQEFKAAAGSARPHHIRNHSGTLSIQSTISEDDDTAQVSAVEFKRQNMWLCLGDFNLDKRCVMYIVQVVMSLIVLCFSMFQLIHLDKENEDPSVYVSLLSGILSWYIPSPSLHH